jgi:hypothetical protein
VRFAARPGADPSKRPIREIVGVDLRLNQRWSTRRAHINLRKGELAVQFQAEHGRPPTPVEALHLAQQATLQTRDAKHQPRSLAEQRSTWMNEASAVLGGRSAVASMVATALTPPPQKPRAWLQLAITPAGAGKTTAMRALTLAWTEGGGQVIGLAPSAAAAAVLGDQTGIRSGDRWTITHVTKHSDLTVRHNRSHLTVRLPTEYVRESTGLGYATTIHAAQGVSADTMHGLLTGQESRQQLYTMLTRGRHANHLYLQAVGDGDPDSVIRPDTISPRTPTETLQQILGRDEASVSASTLLRELNNPAARLFQAVQRYTDGLHVAAEQLLGPQIVRRARSSRPVPPRTHHRTRLGQPCEPTCSPSPPSPVNTHSGAC